MDKVMILGTYDFIGYGICERLLMSGIPVHGLRICENEYEEYLEEKRLLIGRNSNFIENVLGEPDYSINEETVLVISLYDLYFLPKAKNILLEIHQIEGLIKSIKKEHLKKIVCLVPFAFFTTIPQEFKDQMNYLITLDRKLQFIYLPTIYGPWQTSTFLFQQIITRDQKSDFTPILDERESKVDIIYIEDAVTGIVSELQSNKCNDILLKSSGHKKWYKAIDYLNYRNLTILDLQEEEQIGNIKDVIVEEKTTISEGLDIQRKHALRINNLKF